MRLSRRRSLVGLLAVLLVVVQLVSLGPGGRLFAGPDAARAEAPATPDIERA